MQTEIYIVIAIFLLLIFIPIIFSVIRDIDYKRQISGKKPVNQVKKEQIINKDKPLNPEMEATKVAADMHRQQDIIGL